MVLREEVVILLAVVLLREGLLTDHIFHNFCALSDDPHRSKGNKGHEDGASYCHADDKSDADRLAAVCCSWGQEVSGALDLCN